MNKRIVLYGAGKRCRDLYKILEQSQYEVVAILDSNPDTWGMKIGDRSVEAPEKILYLKEMGVCITVANLQVRQTIRNMLQQKYQYNLEKEVNYNHLILDIYRNSDEIRKVMQQSMSSCYNEQNVLFDCYNGLGLGGVEAWTKDICGSLIKNGQKNTFIISDQGDYEVPDALTNHIIKVGINHEERFSQYSIVNLVEAIRRMLPCQIVTCTTNEVMVAAYLVKCYYPDMIKVISVIHNSNESMYADYIDFRECSDLYIGVSQDIIKDMINMGVEASCITSMTCPFQCKAELERTYSVDMQYPIRIGYAGRIEYSQKRMDLLLKCLERLEERQVPFRMELAGDGTAREEMESFIQNRRMEEKVKFLGRLKREEMSLFWKHQDICVNLADFEGRCISIIEAMGNGAIPIVTATSGVREDIVDGVNGYIVPIGEYGAVADYIEYLAEHRNKLSDMGTRAHKAVYPKSKMENHLIFWENILRNG